MDECKTDCTLTSYGKTSEKDFLIMAVREMSRQYVGKTHGQEVVWKECPNTWPSKDLGSWKNPTSTPKDNVVLLRKKFKFLQDNVPPNKFSDIQKNCFYRYEKGQMDELSNLLNFKKITEQVKDMNKFISRVNPLIHSKEIMEVKTLMKQLCSNELVNKISQKRKSQTATQEPVNKKRHYSPSFPPSEHRNLSQLHFRPILPKGTSTNRITVSAGYPSASSSTPKDCLSVQNNRKGITLLSTPSCPANLSDVNSTNIAADYLASASSTPKLHLPLQYNQEFTSSSPDLLASPPDVNSLSTSEPTPAECILRVVQVNQQEDVSSSDQSFSPPDKLSQTVHSFSSEEPSQSTDSGVSSPDTEDEQADNESSSISPQDNSAWDYINKDPSFQDLLENPNSPDLWEACSPLLRVTTLKR